MDSIGLFRTRTGRFATRHQLELPSIISHFGVECRAKSLDLQSTSSLLSTVNLHSPLSTGDDYEFDSRNVRVHACFDA